MNWMRLIEVCVCVCVHPCWLCVSPLSVPVGRICFLSTPPVDKRFPDNAKLDLIFTPVQSDKDPAGGRSHGLEPFHFSHRHNDPINTQSNAQSVPSRNQSCSSFPLPPSGHAHTLTPLHAHTLAPVPNIRHSLLDGHEGRLFSGPEQLSRSDSYQDFREGVNLMTFDP